LTIYPEVQDSSSVLVTSAGTIVGQGIIKCLRLANQSSGPVRYRIIGADASPLAPSLYRTDLGLLVPPISSDGYVDAIIEICKDEAVRAVFPGADEELLILSLSQKRIKDESGAIVLAEPRDVVSVGTDKWLTYQVLKEKGLPCPDSALPGDADSLIEKRGFPLIVKPREGHGSLHFYIVKDKEGMEHSVSRIQAAGWQPMVQEYLPDEDLEFTTGVVTGISGEVLSSIAMKRTLKGGQTFKAFVDDFPEVRRAAEQVAKALDAIGPLNVQCRMSGGSPKTLEVNPRFSASCPIRAYAGVNEPDIVFRNQVLGENVKVGAYKKIVALRFYDEVYVPKSDYDRLDKERRISGSGSTIPDYF
jgi:carbamoyl-phosphate synthase large subunit